MNWLVYHLVSGQSFFTGATLIVIAAFASTRTLSISRRVTVLCFLIGVIAVVLSSTALPYWCYVIAATATCAWIASHYVPAWRSWATWTVVLVWLLAVAIEVPYHISPPLARAGSRAITVIGDSVTAGVGGDEKSERWPNILAREHQIDVQDISHMGETAASALKRAKSHSLDASVIVVEVGGNDVLGSTTAQEFERDLNALLAHLSLPGRQVIMFELPLPPFCHEYGRIQRSMSARYGVSLVPKRVFLSVIAGSDSTLDSIHLSQSGHQLMADRTWDLLKTVFE